MNRYPLWKYIVIVVALVIGLVYTLPNFYGESPAVQVSSGKATVKVTEQTLKTVEDRSFRPTTVSALSKPSTPSTRRMRATSTPSDGIPLLPVSAPKP